MTSDREGRKAHPIWHNSFTRFGTIAPCNPLTINTNSALEQELLNKGTITCGVVFFCKFLSVFIPNLPRWCGTAPGAVKGWRYLRATGQRTDALLRPGAETVLRPPCPGQPRGARHPEALDPKCPTQAF